MTKISDYMHPQDEQKSLLQGLIPAPLKLKLITALRKDKRTIVEFLEAAAHKYIDESKQSRTTASR